MHTHHGYPTLWQFQVCRRRRFIQVPAGSGMDDAGFVQQDIRGEHPRCLGIEQVVLGTVHHVESYRLQVGGNSMAADEAVQGPVEIPQIGEFSFHVSHREISVANELQRRLHGIVRQLGGWTPHHQVADAGELEIPRNRHSHVPWIERWQLRLGYDRERTHDQSRQQAES